MQVQSLLCFIGENYETRDATRGTADAFSSCDQ